VIQRTSKNRRVHLSHLLLCVISCGDGICGSSGDGCDGDGGDYSSGDGCDGDGGGNSGGKSEQTHNSQQVDLLQKALLLLP
jgi:hypothetical protein